MLDDLAGDERVTALVRVGDRAGGRLTTTLREEGGTRRTDCVRVASGRIRSTVDVRPDGAGRLTGRVRVGSDSLRSTLDVRVDGAGRLTGRVRVGSDSLRSTLDVRVLVPAPGRMGLDVVGRTLSRAVVGRVGYPRVGRPE
jgi:hypothetical protein